MKTKKMVIVVLTAALLVLAALVAGCMNPLEKTSDKDKDKDTVDNYQVPAGKGLVRFKITDGDGNSRTILPSTAIAGMFFEFIFTNDDGVSADVRFPTTAGTAVAYGSIAPVSLPYGTYHVAINAHNSGTIIDAPVLPTDPPSTLISGWSGGPYSVSGATTTITAALTGKITPSTGKGIFKYSITVPVPPAADYTTISYDTVDIASMKLNVAKYSTPSTSVAGFPKTLTPATTEPVVTADSTGISFDSGYYLVTVTLKANNCQNRVLRSIMHIYDGLTTTYEEPVPTLVQDRFTVEFDTTGGSAVTSQTINNAGLVARPSPNPTLSGYNFDDWYTTAAKTVVFDFGTTKIFADDKIYAKFNIITGNSAVTVTVSFNGILDGAGLQKSLSNEPLSYNDIAVGTDDITLILTGISTAKWWLNGSEITSLTTGGAGAVLVISKTATPTLLTSLASGPLVIDIEGENGSNIPYSARATVSISN